MKWYERISGVFFNPLDTFEDIAKKPEWGIIPILIIVCLSIISNGIFLYNADMGKLYKKEIKKSSAAAEMSADEIEDQVELATKYSGILGLVSALLGAPLAIFFVAFVFYIIFSLITVKTTFKRSVSVVSHAWLIYGLKTLFFIVIFPFKTIESFQDTANVVQSNLTVFLQHIDPSTPLYTLASSIDIFTLWILGLLCVGFSLVMNKDIKLTTLAVFSVWIVFVTLNVGIAFLFS